jgi:acylpyruvate hydrolase
MRYASCEYGGRRFLAAVDGEVVRPLAGYEEINGAALEAGLEAIPLTHEAFALDAVRLRPVIPNPAKVLCLGTNYAAHAAETSRALPTYPRLFPKFADTLIGPFDRLVLPPESTEVDYEVELAVVVGTRARRVAEEDALQVIAGYAVANDVSVRDYQFRSDQLLPGKAWSATAPLGPWLVTPDEIPDPQNLELRLELGGQVMQHASTSEMIFPVGRIIAIISEFLTLEPGDVILTGTPEGVGFLREPPVFLTDGDVMRTTIDGIGTLVNEVVRGPINS